jgi:hypothetical protein
MKIEAGVEGPPYIRFTPAQPFVGVYIPRRRSDNPTTWPCAAFMSGSPTFPLICCREP